MNLWFVHLFQTQIEGQNKHFFLYYFSWFRNRILTANENIIFGYISILSKERIFGIYFIINVVNLFRTHNFTNFLQFHNYDCHIPQIHQKFEVPNCKQWIQHHFKNKLPFWNTKLFFICSCLKHNFRVIRFRKEEDDKFENLCYFAEYFVGNIENIHRIEFC